MFIDAICHRIFKRIYGYGWTSKCLAAGEQALPKPLSSREGRKERRIEGGREVASGLDRRDM